MGQPWFQCRDLEISAGLISLSSNYALYGDMSNRMMTIASAYAPRQEIYSIDESFLDFTGVRGDLVAIGRVLRAKVLRHTGIPTCTGFGPTKTLAKLANHVARPPGGSPVAINGHTHRFLVLAPSLGPMRRPFLRPRRSTRSGASEDGLARSSTRAALRLWLIS